MEWQQYANKSQASKQTRNMQESKRKQKLTLTYTNPVLFKPHTKNPTNKTVMACDKWVFSG